MEAEMRYAFVCLLAALTVACGQKHPDKTEVHSAVVVSSVTCRTVVEMDFGSVHQFKEPCLNYPVGTKVKVEIVQTYSHTLGKDHYYISSWRLLRNE
jgi:hypothetical protein